MKKNNDLRTSVFSSRNVENMGSLYGKLKTKDPLYNLSRHQWGRLVEYRARDTSFRVLAEKFVVMFWSPVTSRNISFPYAA